jgi:predicted RNA-binding Zn-ribbon protein involved in translation (DUF1610 family)
MAENGESGPTLFERVHAEVQRRSNPDCPACGRVPNWLTLEDAALYPPFRGPGGDGEMTAVSFACSECGFVRVHSVLPFIEQG